MTARTAAETRLQRAMRAFGLRPQDVLRTTRRLAAELQRPDVSRQQLFRFRFDDDVNATEEKIFILVAAFRELTGRLIRANDLFEVEPPLHSGPAPEKPPAPGDEPFEVLYAQYGVLLRGIAMRRYNVPPDDAEALVHDTFIAYLERQTSIREVKGWLVGTVRFKCTHYWRDRKREAPLLPEHEETADPAAETGIRAALERLTIATALSRLGERCRETIRRFYWQEQSMDDIAASFATSQNNVKQILFTCRRRIREFLCGEGRLQS